jgi:hypothetical protein
MKVMLRSIVAVVVGLIVLFLLLMAVEVFSAVVHPLPQDFVGTTEELCRHVEHYPQWVLAIVVPAWGATALASTWTAGRIGSLYSALAVGLLLFAALVFNLSMLPYPIWFKVTNLLVVPVAVLGGIRLALRRKSVSLDKDI